MSANPFGRRAILARLAQSFEVLLGRSWELPTEGARSADAAEFLTSHARNGQPKRDGACGIASAWYSEGSIFVVVKCDPPDQGAAE